MKISWLPTTADPNELVMSLLTFSFTYFSHLLLTACTSSFFLPSFNLHVKVATIESAKIELLIKAKVTAIVMRKLQALKILASPLELA